MTLPIRRVRRVRNIGATATGKRIADDGPEIELWWNMLADELADAGWPCRIPDGDRKPGTGPPDPINLDYNDPTGEQAHILDRKHGDLEALYDHLRIIQTSWTAIRRITDRYKQPAPPHTPGCHVTTCDQPVESRNLNGRTVYVGMVQIAGHWTPKPGNTPTCRQHRHRRTGDEAA